MTIESDCYWMREALVEAKNALEHGEVPVGAVVIHDNKIIARAYNQPISACNPVAHAEISALEMAGKVLGNYRLNNCEIYVTLEPCTMCAGAIVHSRVRRLIYGASEPKAGAIDSVTRVLQQPQMNFLVESLGGVLEAECSKIIVDFFKIRRKNIRGCKEGLRNS